ncbi:DUF3800 domain-containing protein [Bradyrhizobium oligotrophicum S58]
MARTEGYFDESGDFDMPPNIFCLSGYFIDSEAAVEMDVQWGEVLTAHSIPYFHMVDCAHGAGVFAKMSRDERAQIARKLIDLIKKYVLEGVSVVVKKGSFELSETNPDPYTSLVETCVYMLKSFLQGNQIKGDLAYFFEAGHKNKGRAYNNVAQTLTKMSATLNFGDKGTVRLLQAADILAWQTVKYVKDAIEQKRGPRKDFLSLMERPHTLFRMDHTDGTAVIYYELWPQSRRPKSEAALLVGKDRSTTMLFEEGDVPFFNVDKTTGWREGAASLACVGFKAVNETEMVLAFDEPRLYEAINVLMSAMAVYQNSPVGPLTPANGLGLEYREKDIILRVQLTTGKFMNFSFPLEAAKAFKEKLNI